MYIVPSFSNPEVSYTVDMDVGVCECHVGQTGSACKHQYILWTSSLESSSNFLPYLDVLERKKYAEIAIGSTLSIDFYEGIHDRVRNKEHVNVAAVSSVETESSPASNETNLVSRSSSFDMRISVEKITADECKEGL